MIGIMTSIGLPEVALLGLAIVLLFGGTAAIGVLCWVWMKNSRASQSRMEEANREVVLLLREQNRILEDLSRRIGRGE